MSTINDIHNNELSHENINQIKSKKRKLTAKPNNNTITDNNDHQYNTPTKSTIIVQENINASNGLNFEEKNQKNQKENNDMIDVFSLFDSISKENKNVIHNNNVNFNANQTIVDVVKIFSSSILLKE